MFCYCSSLTYLPDISKWNTRKVMDMTGLLMGCFSLSIFPAINKWNIINTTSMNHLSDDCINNLKNKNEFNMIDIDFLSFLPKELNGNHYNLIYNFEEDFDDSDDSDSF